MKTELIKQVNLLFSTALITVGLVPEAGADGTLFDGSIRWGKSPHAQGILASSVWANAATALSWNIRYDLGANPRYPWSYSYTWSTARRSAVQLVLEIPAEASKLDFDTPFGSITEPRWSGYPGTTTLVLPGLELGLRFLGTHTPLTVSFRSELAPTWGDFQAVGGKDGGRQAFAYNPGLESLDPDPPVDYSAVARGDLSTLQHTGDRSGHVPIPGITLRSLFPASLPSTVPENGVNADSRTG